MGKCVVHSGPPAGGAIQWEKLLERRSDYPGGMGEAIDKALLQTFDLILVEVSGVAQANRPGYAGSEICIGSADGPYIYVKCGEQRQITVSRFIFQRRSVKIEAESQSETWTCGGGSTSAPEKVMPSYMTLDIVQRVYGGKYCLDR